MSRRIRLFTGAAVAAGTVTMCLWLVGPDQRSKHDQAGATRATNGPVTTNVPSGSPSSVTSITNNFQQASRKHIGRTRPRYLDELLVDVAKSVDWNEVERQPLIPSEVQELMSRYRSIYNVTNKMNIARVLSMHATDEVAELFLHTLLDEYAGRQIGSAVEVSQLTSLAALIGYAAGSSERAMEIARDGLRPEYWRGRIRWSSPIPEGEVERWLVESCIHGLQSSGREDAWALILDLASNAPPSYLRTFAGAILDAAFWRYQKQHGKAGPIKGDMTAVVTEYLAWRTTEEGREWNAWYLRCTAEEQ